jgi:glutathione S-transferase
MGLKLYGWARSRARRCIWMLKELGVAFEHDPIAHTDPRLKGPEFAKISPQGTVPVLVDDGFALDESLAINLYLAKKYGLGALYPERATEEAMCWRWTLWSQLEMEAPLTAVFHHRFLKPEAERDEALAVAGEAALQKPLAALDKALEGRPWLVGHRFTVADLNVAAILAPNRIEHISLGKFDNVRTWVGRCYQRPAAVASMKMAAA